MSKHDELTTPANKPLPVDPTVRGAGHDRNLSPVPNVHVEVFDGTGRRLPDIAAAWQQALDGAPLHQQIFTFEYVAAWLRHETIGGRWSGHSRVLVARSETGEVVGLLPLASRRCGPLRMWMLAGPYEPLRGFICHTACIAPVCAAFARTLASMHVWSQSVRLGPIDTSFPECAELVAAMERATRRFVTFETPAGVYDGAVPSNEVELEARIKASSTLSRTATRQRRMEREEGLRIERHANPCGAALNAVLKICQDIERRSWLASAPDGRLRFASDSQLAFWTEARQGKPGWDLDIWVVYLRDEPVAFDVVLTAGTHRYLYAGQYDQHHRKLGLGWMLYMAYTREGVERGVRSIDMGPGSIEYKQQIGGVARDHRRDVVVVPGGPLGAAAAMLASLAPVRKLIRTVRRLRGSGGQFLASLSGRRSAGSMVLGSEYLLRNGEIIACEVIYSTGSVSLLALAV